MPRILAARDRVAQPWKNGGGLTREIAVHPPGAGMDTFDWRVSTAVVASDGPFSRFDGVDRVLLLLEGEVMDLAIDGADPVRLTRESDPLAFAADAPCEAWIPKGSISDLNIMVRRGACSAKVDRRDGAAEIAAEDDHCIVMALDRIASDKAPLERHDALLLEPGQSVTLSGSGRWVLVRLTPQ